MVSRWSRNISVGLAGAFGSLAFAWALVLSSDSWRLWLALAAWDSPPVMADFIRSLIQVRARALALVEGRSRYVSATASCNSGVRLPSPSLPAIAASLAASKADR